MGGRDPVQVELYPSSRRFELQPGESLLQAGLRAGVNLPYRCSNGTCGDCRAELLQGSVEQLQHTDYALTAAERARGVILTCSHTALDSVTLRVEELRDVANVPHQTVVAKVTSLERVAPDYLILHARTPRSSHLQFLAGQSVDVTLPNEMSRSLPLANCPCDGMRPQFHLRRRAGDPFSEFAFNDLDKADRVTLTGPSGNFVLDETSTHNLLLVAFAQGFAPIYSLLEHAIALEWPARLHLLWLNDDDTFYHHNYCRATADALDEFSYDLVDSTDAGSLSKALSRLEGSFDVYAAVPDSVWISLRDALAASTLQIEQTRRMSTD